MVREWDLELESYASHLLLKCGTITTGFTEESIYILVMFKAINIVFIKMKYTHIFTRMSSYFFFPLNEILRFN